MPAFFELVVVDEVGIRALCPALRRWTNLVGKDAHGDRDRDALDAQICELVSSATTNTAVRRPSAVADAMPCSRSGTPVPAAMNIVVNTTPSPMLPDYDYQDQLRALLERLAEKGKREDTRFRVWDQSVKRPQGCRSLIALWPEVIDSAIKLDGTMRRRPTAFEGTPATPGARPS